MSVETVDEAHRALRHPNVQTIQIIFNMFRLKPAEELFAQAWNRHVGILARVPLASGLLTGKLTKASSFAADDHRSFNRHGEAFDKGETFSGVPYEIGLEAVERLRPLVPPGATLGQLALRWTLMFEAVSCAIPGARTAQQARDNAAAADLPPLAPATMAAVRAVYDEMDPPARPRELVGRLPGRRYRAARRERRPAFGSRHRAVQSRQKSADPSPSSSHHRSRWAGSPRRMPSRVTSTGGGTSASSRSKTRPRSSPSTRDSRCHSESASRSRAAASPRSRAALPLGPAGAEVDLDEGLAQGLGCASRSRACPARLQRRVGQAAPAGTSDCSPRLSKPTQPVSTRRRPEPSSATSSV